MSLWPGVIPDLAQACIGSPPTLIATSPSTPTITRRPSQEYSDVCGTEPTTSATLPQNSQNSDTVFSQNVFQANGFPEDLVKKTVFHQQHTHSSSFVEPASVEPPNPEQHPLLRGHTHLHRYLYCSNPRVLLSDSRWCILTWWLTRLYWRVVRRPGKSLVPALRAWQLAQVVPSWVPDEKKEEDGELDWVWRWPLRHDQQGVPEAWSRRETAACSAPKPSESIEPASCVRSVTEKAQHGWRSSSGHAGDWIFLIACGGLGRIAQVRAEEQQDTLDSWSPWSRL